MLDRKKLLLAMQAKMKGKEIRCQPYLEEKDEKLISINSPDQYKDLNYIQLLIQSQLNK